MEVILLEDVPNLGHIGALVKVAPGYGRNFLLPKKKAVAASRTNKKHLEHQKRVAGFKLAKEKAHAEKVVARLNSLKVKIARKVGEQDKLFGSVTAHDVADELARQGVEVDRRKVDLAEPIKTTGEFEVMVRLAGDVRGKIKLVIVPE